MLSASNMPIPHTSHSDPDGQVRTTVLLLPAFKFVDHVTPAAVSSLIEHCVNTGPTNTTPYRDLQNDAAADALRELSDTRPQLVTEITIPFLLSKLPSQNEQTDRSYLEIFEAISLIGSSRNLVGTVIRRLYTRLEMLLALPCLSRTQTAASASQ